MSLNPWDETKRLCDLGSDVVFCPIGLDEGGIGRKAFIFKGKKRPGFSVDLPLTRSILTSSELPKTLGEGGFSSQFLNILLDNMRLADGTGGGSELQFNFRNSQEAKKLPSSNQAWWKPSIYWMISSFKPWMLRIRFGVIPWFHYVPLVSAGPICFFTIPEISWGMNSPSYPSRWS